MTGTSPSGRSTISRIAHSGSQNLLAAGVGSLANLAIVVIITRGWSPALAGSFFAVTSVFLLILSLVELGVDQGFVRFHARNLSLGRAQSNRRIQQIGYASVLSVSAITAGLLALTAELIGRLVSDASTHQDATRMMLVLAPALPIAAAYDLVLAQTRGHSWMRPTILVERICRPTLQVLLLLSVALSSLSTPALMAGAWVAPYALGLVVMLVLVRRIGPIPHSETPAGSGIGREFWRFTAPRGVARFFQVGLQRADIAIVAALAGPAAGALYTAATRFLVVGQVATQALQQVSEPHLARLLALDESAAVRAVYHQLILWSVALTWPLYLLVAVFAPQLLVLVFGAEYAQGGLALTILALSMLFATAMGPVDVLLLMAGRSGLSLINTGTALAIDVVGCFALIPLFGIEGAAAAWAAAIVGRNVMGIVQIRRYLHMTPLAHGSATMGLTCIVIFGAVPAAAVMLADGMILPLVSVGLCLAVYALVIWRRAGSLALTDLVRRRGPGAQPVS